MYARAMTVLLAGALLSSPTDAQQRGQGPQQPMQAHDMMQMHGMMPSPAMILQLREPLGLTETQVQRIEAIRDRVQREHEPHGKAAMQAMHEASQILEGATPEVSGYEAKLKDAANHMVQGHVVMTRGWVEAREVLTPEQRSNLQFGMKVMRQMMGTGMQGMMGERRPGMMRDTTSRSMRH